ncbi:hypothetical protein EJ377_02630 [Chryseobacterium arthrosphaerae]|uniref:Uncharacterized protein n=1 Tax=Chryseobacterium arthrosphaerae TaxID=651561 RepID=A0A3S0N5A5_9FLAO|nr:hypothetical protein EJ377_02630 [Chryseobacterium arthrosphaerae]
MFKKDSVFVINYNSLVGYFEEMKDLPYQINITKTRISMPPLLWIINRKIKYRPSLGKGLPSTGRLSGFVLRSGYNMAENRPYGSTGIILQP